ncbi:MAG: CbbQ/NirQ/NorQ/GpvN family protein [Thermoleophilia bacterium]|nr:CbbQ/NirQ/NorQ/GpvN family protein [Thermoleophilia bacterium]
MTPAGHGGEEFSIEDYRVLEEPYYRPAGDEVELFIRAHQLKLPVMLKGPTGSGKTRFLQYMAYRLGLPLVTVACHEDLTASDLVGRYLFVGNETRWVDGPLTVAVKHGAICYLDELVEARKDTTVVIHPLGDDRRILPIEKKGHIVEAHDDFMLVVSFNPGYQSILKDLKQSTRQRFLALDFNYLDKSAEAEIVMRETAVDDSIAVRLVELGTMIRNLRDHGLEEGVSTRLLVYAARLIGQGVPPRRAAEVAMAKPLTDDGDMLATLRELVEAVFEA